MAWNYRVIRKTTPDPTTFIYYVTEVFYGDNSKIGWIDPVDYGNQSAESPEALKNNLTLMLTAFERPVLEEHTPEDSDVPTLREIAEIEEGGEASKISTE